MSGTLFTPSGDRITTHYSPPPRAKNRTRSQGSATYEDFVELLVELGKKVMPDVLITEEDPQSDAQTPVVTFEVIHEAPIRTEIKPRPRDVFKDIKCVQQNTGLQCTEPQCSNYPYWTETCGREVYPYDATYYRPEGKAYMVWGQIMSTMVQFNCWGETGPEAAKLSTRFRDFMFQFTGVFMQQGVKDIIFLERLRDRTITKWKDNIFSRAVRYKMAFENLYIQEYGIISKIVVGLNPEMRPFYERSVSFDAMVAIQ